MVHRHVKGLKTFLWNRSGHHQISRDVENIFLLVVLQLFSASTKRFITTDFIILTTNQILCFRSFSVKSTVCAFLDLCPRRAAVDNGSARLQLKCLDVMIRWKEEITGRLGTVKTDSDPLSLSQLLAKWCPTSVVRGEFTGTSLHREHGFVAFKVCAVVVSDYFGSSYRWNRRETEAPGVADRRWQHGEYEISATSGRAGARWPGGRVQSTNSGWGVFLPARRFEGTSGDPRLHQQLRVSGVPLELRVFAKKSRGGTSEQHTSALPIPGRLCGQWCSLDAGAGAAGRRPQVSVKDSSSL